MLICSYHGFVRLVFKELLQCLFLTKEASVGK